MNIRTHILALCCLFILGCGAKQRELDPPAIVMSDFAKDVPDVYSAWQQEAKRRFPYNKTLLIFCHGNTVDDRWCIVPDQPRKVMPVQQFADAIHNAFPQHIKIFITCNPNGLKITTPMTYFALANVWLRPDAKEWSFREKHKGFWTVGDIDEFVSSVEK